MYNYSLNLHTLSDFFYRDAFDSDSFFQSIFEPKFKTSHPVDIVDLGDKGVEICIAAIGLDKKDIKVNVKDNVLTVSYDKEKDDTKYIQRGITKKSFKQEWKIGDSLDAMKLEASLDKGLLTIRIPLSEKSKSKSMDVKIN